jgi:soluble lytic murein transglycosylase
MRQESMFSPQIMSPVGAVGLMQIMPYTGKEIADDLKYISFEKDHLLIPELNIDFGVYDLSKLLKQTKGDFVQSLGGYNGGPHNVKKWAKNNESILNDEPLFVECLGFAETRGYVKKVLENYWVYKLIHF